MLQKEKRQYLTVSEITGLPSIPFISLNLGELLEETGQIAVLYLAIFWYEKEEGGFDWSIWDWVLKQTAKILQDLQGKVFRKDDIVSTYKDSKNNLLILLAPPRTRGVLTREDLKEVRDRIIQHLREKVEQRFGSYECQKLGLYLGYSLASKNSRLSAAKMLDLAVDEAYQMTIEEEEQERLKKMDGLKHLIDQKSIHVLFQPIVHLETSEILGYEALSRGPESSRLENPDLLFYLAHKADMTLVLEEICHKRAILDILNLRKAEKLFLNTEMEVIHDEGNKDLELVAQAGLRPEDIVIELDEKKAIKSIPLFRAAVKYFREQGFLIGVEGIDSSYESLQPIIELQPEFIKIGLPLIRGIDSDPTKQELVRTLVKISEDLPSIMIAVGIETDQERKTLQDIGIFYGQGYSIAVPSTHPENLFSAK